MNLDDRFKITTTLEKDDDSSRITIFHSIHDQLTNTHAHATVNDGSSMLCLWYDYGMESRLFHCLASAIKFLEKPIIKSDDFELHETTQDCIYYHHKDLENNGIAIEHYLETERNFQDISNKNFPGLPFLVWFGDTCEYHPTFQDCIERVNNYLYEKSLNQS